MMIRLGGTRLCSSVCKWGSGFGRNRSRAFKKTWEIPPDVWDEKPLRPVCVFKGDSISANKIAGKRRKVFTKGCLWWKRRVGGHLSDTTPSVLFWMLYGEHNNVGGGVTCQCCSWRLSQDFRDLYSFHFLDDKKGNDLPKVSVGLKYYPLYYQSLLEIIKGNSCFCPENS